MPESEEKLRERAVAAMAGVPIVQRSVKLEDFAARCHAYVYDPIGCWGDRFDACPILRARQNWIQNMPVTEGTIDWFLARIRAYSLLSDYPTTLMLLRHAGTQYRGEKHAEVVREMSRICRELLGKHVSDLEDAFVILCGKLLHHPEMWPHGKDAVDAAFRKYWPNFPGECNQKLLLRILRVIGRCDAAEYLPSLKERAPKYDGYLGYQHLVKYTDVCSDLIALEGYRLFLVEYFRNLFRKITVWLSDQEGGIQGSFIVYLEEAEPTVAAALVKAGIEIRGNENISFGTGRPEARYCQPLQMVAKKELDHNTVVRVVRA